MNILRLDTDRYMIGGVVMTRTDAGWAAVPPSRSGEFPVRPLFTCPTLDEALDMAAGAIELFRPAD